MPDGSRRRRKAAVLFLNAEDGLDDTLQPRLEAAGADLERVFSLGGIRLEDPAGGGLSFPQHLDCLHRAVVAHEPELVVVDPMMAFFPPEVLANNDQTTRGQETARPHRPAGAPRRLYRLALDRSHAAAEESRQTPVSVRPPYPPRTAWRSDGLTGCPVKDGPGSGLEFHTAAAAGAPPDFGAADSAWSLSFPSSAWERQRAKLCFASPPDQDAKQKLSRTCVPKQSLGTREQRTSKFQRGARRGNRS